MLPAVRHTLQRMLAPFRGGIQATGPRGEMARGFGSESYKGASTFRQAGKLWGASWGSADTDFIPAQEILRARSRHLIRNNPLAAGALQTISDNVIGPGLRLHPEMDREVLGLSDDEAENLERQFLRVFNEWAESVECDLNRMQDFYALQRLAYHSVDESGDILCLAPTVRRAGARLSTRVQIVEADRVSNPQWQINTPTLVGGVELDANGAPWAYHIQQGHPGGYVEMTAAQQTWQQVSAFGASSGRRNAWLIFRRQRPGQHRGIPYMATVLEPLKQLERYTDQEIQAAIIGGSVTLLVTTPDGQGIAPFANLGTPQQAANENNIELGYGLVGDLAPGEDIKVVNPNRPNTAFGDFVMQISEQIGTGMGLPFELLKKRFTASYSASRAALLEAWKFFRVQRTWFASSYCAPFYELVITEAVARGILSAPGFLDDPAMRRAYLKANWVGPVPGALNPVDEVAAAEKRIEIGISTVARESLEANGSDWEANHAQRAKEVRMRRADGLEPTIAPPLPPVGTIVSRPQPGDTPAEPDEEQLATESDAQA